MKELVGLLLVAFILPLAELTEDPPKSQLICHLTGAFSFRWSDKFNIMDSAANRVLLSE